MSINPQHHRTYWIVRVVLIMVVFAAIGCNGATEQSRSTMDADTTTVATTSDSEGHANVALVVLRCHENGYWEAAPNPVNVSSPGTVGFIVLDADSGSVDMTNNRLVRRPDRRRKVVPKFDGKVETEFGLLPEMATGDTSHYRVEVVGCTAPPDDPQAALFVPPPTMIVD